MIEVQDERSGEPLFLDEDPSPPRRVKRDTSHIDSLFADEDVLAEPKFPDPQPEEDMTSPGSRPVEFTREEDGRTLERRVRMALIVAMILAAVAFGFAAVRAFLLQ
ncbi:MAG TPA: hypothetical protein VLD67_14770 [Vicinamibacterales bacterium]|nr:hypothetical protein [Vicinamibacterales bacterium]